MSTSATSLEDALAACLDDLAQGASPAQCLARFHEQASELAPLLQVAVRAQAQPLPALSLSGRVRGRERMHAALTQRAAGSGGLHAWLGGLAVAAVLLALAAGAWLSWPGRDRRLGGVSTVQPASPSIAATATPSATPMATPTAHKSSTPTRSLSPASEGAPATATATPSPTWSTTPTSRPTASASPSRHAIPTNAPSAADTASAASPTIRPAETATRGPEETPEANETPEPAETHEPTEPAETHESTEPAETREHSRAPATGTPRPESTATHGEPPGATPAGPTAAPNSQPTERPEATSTPGQAPAATSTRDDDDHARPESTEPPERRSGPA